MPDPDYLRFKTRPPAPRTPPAGFVDLRWSAAEGKLVTRNASGVDAPLAEEILDDDGNLPVQGIVLSDSGNVSLAEGVLSQNSDGHIVKHDGISDGDDLPYLEYAWRLSGYQEITAGQNQAGVNRELGRITIPASLATAGRDILVVGSFSVEHGGTTHTPAYVLGFVPAGATLGADVGVGYINNVTNQSQTIPAFCVKLTLFSAGSVYALTPNVEPVGVLISGNAAGTAKIYLSQLAYQGNLSEEGPLGVTHDLILYYSAPATPSAPASEVTVNFLIYPL